MRLPAQSDMERADLHRASHPGSPVIPEGGSGLIEDRKSARAERPVGDYPNC